MILDDQDRRAIERKPSHVLMLAAAFSRVSASVRYLPERHRFRAMRTSDIAKEAADDPAVRRLRVGDVTDALRVPGE
jgi:hypothetical protein